MRTKRSKEDYLEAIFLLTRKGIPVRSVDVAEHLNYTKPSVSRAMALLVKDNMITFDECKFIHLTETGYQVASKTYEKHLFFKEMLEQAGVTEDTATRDACLIEHAISNEAFDKIKAAYTKNLALKSE